MKNKIRSNFLFLCYLLTTTSLAQAGEFNPPLVPPVKKIVNNFAMTCALDAEALKCWNETFGHFPYPHEDVKLITEKGVDDFFMDEFGDSACFFRAGIYQCVSSESAKTKPNELWPNLGPLRKVSVPYQSRPSFLCVENEIRSGVIRRTCGAFGERPKSRFLNDELNDGEEIANACEVDLKYNMAERDYERGQPYPIDSDLTAPLIRSFLRETGIVLNKNSSIKVDGYCYRENSKSYDSRGNVFPKERQSGELTVKYAGFKASSPFFCPAPQAAVPFLPETDCRNGKVSRLTALQERMSFFDRNQSAAAMEQILKDEWNVTDFKIDRGDAWTKYSGYSQVLSFRGPLGNRVYGLDLSEIDLKSYAKFHVWWNKSKSQLKIYNNNWVELPIKAAEGAARRFVVEKETFTCIQTKCFRVKK